MIVGAVENMNGVETIHRKNKLKNRLAADGICLSKCLVPSIDRLSSRYMPE